MPRGGFAMKFTKENRPVGGRPKGAKNRLASRVLGDLIQIWDEPHIGPDGKPMLDGNGDPVTRGIAALRIMSKQKPVEFSKLYAGILPKEFWHESTLSELGDGEIDGIIEAMRERVRLLREQNATVIDVTPTKVLADASEGGA